VHIYQICDFVGIIYIYSLSEIKANLIKYIILQCDQISSTVKVHSREMKRDVIYSLRTVVLTMISVTT